MKEVVRCNVLQLLLFYRSGKATGQRVTDTDIKKEDISQRDILFFIWHFARIILRFLLPELLLQERLLLLLQLLWLQRRLLILLSF